MSAPFRSSAHYLGHLDAFKPSLTVSENLAFWICYLGGAPASATPRLRPSGLGGLADLPAAYLSAGQRRRLSLARLVAVPRPIWLLDEPTSALDSAGQERLTELMREHLAGGGMIVAATHGPLGIEREGTAAREPPHDPPLRPDAARHAPRHAGRRRRADGRAVLPHRRDPGTVRGRARSRAVAPHRPGDPVARRAARLAARARPPVRRRPRRRLARPAADGRHAARTRPCWRRRSRTGSPPACRW